MPASNAKTSSAATATAPRELTITRQFDAPRDLVWKAWTDVRHLAQWWGRTVSTIPYAKSMSAPAAKFAST